MILNLNRMPAPEARIAYTFSRISETAQGYIALKIQAKLYLSCLCACGRSRCNDNKDNHVVGGLVVYQGAVQWCCCTTPAYDCKVKAACQVIVLSGLL